MYDEQLYTVGLDKLYKNSTLLTVYYSTGSTSCHLDQKVINCRISNIFTKIDIMFICIFVLILLFVFLRIIYNKFIINLC